MDNENLTYVVVLASPEMSECERGLLAQFGASYPVIAVDGGYEWCMQAGVPVAHAIGDFDSLGYVPSGIDVQVHPCEKDATDCELALSFARSIGAERIVVFAAFGGRLDHGLSAVQMMAHEAECGCEVIAFGDGYALRVMVGPSTLSLPALPHGTVSLIAATEKVDGINIEGLKYSLQSGSLTNRMSLCVSNEFVGKPVTLSIETGTLFAIVPVASVSEKR